MNAAPSRPWEYSAFRVRVDRTARLSPGFVRITLAGDALRNFAPWGLDQRIKLVLPMRDGTTPEFGLQTDPTPHPREWYARWKALPEDERNVLRTYTPSAIRSDAGEIDVDVFVHEPAGPASTWAMTCAPGDELTITGPDARAGWTGYGIHFVPPQGYGRLLLIGDESALPAVRNIVCAMPPTAMDVLLEVADPDDAVLAASVAPESRARIRVVARDGMPGKSLEKAARAWLTAHSDLLAGAYAWIAGEASATTRIRGLLTAGGMTKEQVAFLGYWKSGGPLVG